MTDTNEIAAIRQRADEMRGRIYPMSALLDELMQLADDRAALLVHIDKLQERLHEAEKRIAQEEAVAQCYFEAAEALPIEMRQRFDRELAKAVMKSPTDPENDGT